MAEQKQVRKFPIKTFLAYLFIIAGIIGCIAAMTLTYDKIKVIHDPSYAPNCNINPVLSCGSVMKTEQANLLGLPNTIFGIIGFSALTTIGFTILAGATFKRWFWIAVNIGAAAAFGFTYYLFFQGVFRINAICPFCFVIWMVVPPILLYTTVYNLKEGNLKLGLNEKIRAFIVAHHLDFLIAWYVIVFGILLTHFWYYWKTLI